MYFRIACPGPWVLLINTFRHTVFAATFRINEIKLFCDVRRTNEDTLIHSQHFVLNGALHQVCALPESILGVHCLAPPPPTPQDPIFSFLHTFPPKIVRVGGPPQREIMDPPQGWQLQHWVCVIVKVESMQKRNYLLGKELRYVII